MARPLASRSSLARRVVGLCATLALLASTLLAAGAHQHLGPSSPEVVCSIDHESSASSDRAAGVHAAARPHRHHCASCQLAAKGVAHEPALTGFLARPAAHAGLGVQVVGPEHGQRYTTASPRGPPAS